MPIDLNARPEPIDSLTFSPPAAAKAVALGCVWPIAIISVVPLMLVPFVVMSRKGSVSWPGVVMVASWALFWVALATSLWRRASRLQHSND